MSTPVTANAADILPKSTYWQLVHTLRAILPPPVDDSPEAAAHRDLDTIAHVACLLPVTPEEAHLAAQYIAAGAQAQDCLRLARAYPNDPALILKCTAQSASMMRQARGWRTALQRAQAERRSREADPAASNAATAIEQRTLALGADALLHAPAAAASAPAAQAKPDPTAAAERYALLHRKRAMLIRRLGRLPEKTNIGWLPPEVVHAIATGTTPILRALDEKPQRQAALAA